MHLFYHTPNLRQVYNRPLFNTYESYWKSIESLSNAWKKRLNIVVSDSETTSNLLSDLKNARKYKSLINDQEKTLLLPFSKLLKFFRFMRETVDSTMKHNVSESFTHCFDTGIAQLLLDKLFVGDPSCKHLRDKIAHGLISEDVPAEKAMVSNSLTQLQSVSRQFITSSIKKFISAHWRT